ncbi:hypothetical protein ACLMJK_005243 [Lecanora helva]
MPELSDFQVGQIIELTDGRTATIRFLGNPHFAAGEWVGVELDDATGKNDGAVQGRRYFDCSAGYGMFVKPNAIAVPEDQPTAKPAARTNGKPNGLLTKGRPSSVNNAGAGKRQSIIDPTATKRRSVNAGSPTPAARSAGASRLASPSKSPTKQLGPTTSSSNSTRTNTPSGAMRKPLLPASKASRPSIAPTPRNSRPSINPGMNGTARPSSTSSAGTSRAHSKRPSLAPGVKDKFNHTRQDVQPALEDNHASQAEGVQPVMTSPSPSEAHQEDSVRAPESPLSRTSALSPVATSQLSPASRGISPPDSNRRFPSSSAVGNKRIEEFEAKIRILEKKRIDDREKIKDLEKAQFERDRFESIIQKLQAKLQPQQHEIAELRKQIRDVEARHEALEAQQAENDTINEMATLDREMAEETAESLKLELDSLRQRHEEIELEVEVLRDENQELGKEMSPEERTSQGWLQMERTNERLREALLRLRDVTQQQEADLKKQVSELEQDLEESDKIKTDYQHTKEKLSQTDAMLEDVRQQLDTALGAEEMIEELTERNMGLNEKMEELRQNIEELESLKELNDELEINHIENEKQLQDEIDYTESLLADEARKSAIQDGTIQELEYTVNRFRDLAKSMQGDLEDMRAAQQITDAEAQDLGNRSRAMMDLNMRLQVSASKVQTKAIDLELGKLEAQESSEHLAIVQLFLPETFKSEHDSVRALLRFRRIDFKANMMHAFVKEQMNTGTSPKQEDDVFVYCDLLDNLTWLSGICQRFVHMIQTCDLQAFRRLGGAAYELEPVERSLNVWIDSLKRDELKSQQCSTEIQRSIALMNHLAEVHISEELEHYADDINVRAQMMQSHLETTATALSLVKSVSETTVTNTHAEDEEGILEYEDYLTKLDTLISQTRSAKVISNKAIRQLEDLKSRSLTLNPSTLKVVETSQQSASELAASSRNSGTSVARILGDEGRTNALTPQELSNEITAHISFPSLTNKIQSTTSHLQAFYNLTSSLTQTVEFPSPPPPPPWQILAQNVRAATADMASRETELTRLKDEMTEKNTTLALKDKMTQEMSVKVEVLEKRMGEAGGRREKVKELELELDMTKQQEKYLLNKLSDLQTELHTLESEREKWKQSPQVTSPTVPPGGSQGAKPPPTSESTLRQISALRTQISNLESSIRYLRSASHAHSLSRAYDFLSSPITPPPPPQPLIQTEAKDILKEMLNLISQPENQTIRLQARQQQDRLKWQPVRETSAWKVRRQREEWEEWREWRDGLARKVVRSRREEERRRAARMEKTGGGGLKERDEMLARVQIALPEKIKGMEGGRVNIVKPDDWERVEEALGI